MYHAFWMNSKSEAFEEKLIEEMNNLCKMARVGVRPPTEHEVKDHSYDDFILIGREKTRAYFKIKK